MDNISEKNHERCKEVAEKMLRTNGYSVTFSLNLYSKDQDLEKQCEEIDAIYQKVGLPKDQQYKIRVSPAFPIIGGEANVYLPIRDYPKVGRQMLKILQRFPQMCFRFGEIEGFTQVLLRGEVCNDCLLVRHCQKTD